MKRVFLGLAVGLLSMATSHCDEVPRIQNTVSVATLDVIAHDPVILKEGDRYYLFTTGPGVTIWSSDDMESWTMQEPVFAETPEWMNKAVVGFKGHMWAPDISLRDGVYYLYYSVSTFGKNNSCIGLATTTTLDQASPEYFWTDHGIVVESKPEKDDWNAIDPNLFYAEDGKPYLAFGSFWSGLKVAELKSNLSELLDPEEEPMPLASRVRIPVGGDGDEAFEAGNTAIEGPYVYRRGDYFYLFASVDYCCRGSESTYKMVFGRSKNALGPYYDESGIAMLDGGGTLLAEGNERWHGVGHNAICEIDGTEFVVFHGYDGLSERGRPKLRIEPLLWTDDGWPYLEL